MHDSPDPVSTAVIGAPPPPASVSLLDDLLLATNHAENLLPADEQQY